MLRVIDFRRSWLGIWNCARRGCPGTKNPKFECLETIRRCTLVSFTPHLRPTSHHGGDHCWTCGVCRAQRQRMLGQEIGSSSSSYFRPPRSSRPLLYQETQGVRLIILKYNLIPSALYLLVAFETRKRTNKNVSVEVAHSLACSMTKLLVTSIGV